MKIQCSYPGCPHTTHKLSVRMNLPGSGETHESQWFCSRRCYKNFLADSLIEDKRNGIKGNLHRVRLGQLLVKNHIIRKDQLNQALEAHSGSLKKLGQILVESRHITADQLKAALSMQSGIAPINLDNHTKIKLKEEIPFKLVNEFHFVLFEHDEEARTIAVALYNIDHLPFLEHYFANLYPKFLCKFFLENQKQILNVIANNYPEEKISLPLEEKLSAPGNNHNQDIQQAVTRTLEFLHQITGQQVKIDNLDNAVWLKGNTPKLNIDVYITAKGN